MLKSKIKKLKDIGADFLLETYCQPYAEGVESAWHMFNSIVETEDAELKILSKLVRSYLNKEKAPNNAEELFEKGIIDFYQYVLNYEDTQKEKQYRPCTLDEFSLNIGDLIKFRKKEDHDFEVGTMYMGYIKTNGTVRVLLGDTYYSLEGLFYNYEWFDKDSNTWKPFGVEE